MTMMSSARLSLHPARRLHDGHPPKRRRSLAPVCLFGVCDAVDALRVFHREMDAERRRLADTYELLASPSPSPSPSVSASASASASCEERVPLNEARAEGSSWEAATPVATPSPTPTEAVARGERTPSTSGGKVARRRQIKLTDLWSLTKRRGGVGVGVGVGGGVGKKRASQT